MTTSNAGSNAGKPITIADYDPAWVTRFEAERALIYETCGRDAFTRIEHIGSTAVVGLAAKPIIDMMPGVRSLDDAPPIIERLRTIGYHYVPEFEFDDPVLGPGMPFRRYLRKDIDGQRAFHMHMVEHGSEFWFRHLLFRNVLRVRPKVRDAYADLKRRLANDFNAALTPTSNINVGYTDNKTDFVETVIARAQEFVGKGEPITIDEYNPEWARRFERERTLIAPVAGDVAVDIQHVGSTSVPGLPAKPIVDIAMGVRSMDEGRALAGALATIGFVQPPGASAMPDDWTMFDKYDDGVETEVIHLHLVPHDGERWRAYVRFRDYLRAHPDAVIEYAAVKRDLAIEFGRDRLGYTEAKSDFIMNVQRLAMESSRSDSQVPDDGTK